MWNWAQELVSTSKIMMQNVAYAIKQLLKIEKMQNVKYANI